MKVREQPSAIEIEELVLGAMLSEISAVTRACNIIEGRQVFYLNAHQAIYDAMYGAFMRSEAVDLMTVTHALKTHLNAVGGPYYLVELVNKVGSTANLEGHCRILLQQYIGRQLIKVCEITTQNVFNGSDSLGELQKLEKSLSEIMNINPGAKTGAKVIEQVWENAKSMADRKGEMVGSPFTGVVALDRLLGGWEAGDVIAFAGRPKSGKSSITNNILRYAVLHDIPLLSCSGEMQNIKSGARLAAALSGIPTRDIEKGNFFASKDDLRKFENAYEIVKNSKILFDDSSLSVSKMRSDILLHYYEHGVKLFLYDQLDLFEEIQSSRDDFKARMTVMSAIRRLANELGIGIIVYSQVNTDAEKTAHKRPEARHIFGGMGVQGNATKAALIYRPDSYKLTEFMDGPWLGYNAKGKAEVYTVLNNYDDLGSVLLNFDGKRQVFEDLVEQQSIQVVDTPIADLPF